MSTFNSALISCIINNKPADQVEIQNHQRYIHTFVKKKKKKSEIGEHYLLSLAAFCVLNRIKSKPSQAQVQLGLLQSGFCEALWHQVKASNRNEDDSNNACNKTTYIKEYRRNSRTFLKRMRGGWWTSEGGPAEIRRAKKKQRELIGLDCRTMGGSSQRETSGVFGAQTHRPTAVHYKAGCGVGSKEKKRWDLRWIDHEHCTWRGWR